MVTEEDTLPFDIRMVTPGTPENEALQAESAAFQRNSAYYEEHADELIERYPGPCIVVVYNDDQVRSFQQDLELESFLESLSEFERASAFEIDHQDPSAIVIPTLVVLQ
ncbi:MAG: hypothetical protein OXI41_15235 [Chloroflexota bacterium]|nr:hypothetical protein [Chloroflexota bacterium]MDE2895209.1 hypothetical protein [Chloroflexota bacterium]